MLDDLVVSVLGAAARDRRSSAGLLDSYSLNMA